MYLSVSPTSPNPLFNNFHGERVLKDSNQDRPENRILPEREIYSRLYPPKYPAILATSFFAKVGAIISARVPTVNSRLG